MLRHDGAYHMFYASFQSREQPTAIGYARSDDGLTWTKFLGNPVLSRVGCRRLIGFHPATAR